MGLFGVLAQPIETGTRLGVDVEGNRRLVDEAAPFGCIFHHAFDDVPGAGVAVRDAVRDVMGCGLDGILTSGGPRSAVDNPGVLEEIVSAVDGKMGVLVGGGVRVANAARILEVVGGAEPVLSSMTPKLNFGLHITYTTPSVCRTCVVH